MSHENIKTLVLNSGFQPVKPISWKRAISLLFLEKVEVLQNYEEHYINTITLKLPMPAVIRLNNGNYNEIPSMMRFSRNNVYIRDNYQCLYCGKYCNIRDITLDHVVPKSFGGKKTWTNMATSCKKCNTKKANRTPQQAGMILIRQPVFPAKKDFFKNLIKENMPEEWKQWIYT